MQTQETESAERSATAAAAELRRLLRRFVANVEAKSIEQREWWSTNIDTLTDLMGPLWAQIGFKKPGVSVEVWKRPIIEPIADAESEQATESINAADQNQSNEPIAEAESEQETEPISWTEWNQWNETPRFPQHWIRSLKLESPDNDETLKITLSAGIGSQKYETQARALTKSLLIVQAWIDLIDTKYLTTKSTTTDEADNAGTEPPETVDDWKLALSVLTDKRQILAKALLETKIGLTHKEMAGTGAVEGKAGGPPTSDGAKRAKFDIMGEWESLKGQWTREKYKIEPTEATKSKREKRFKAYAEKIDV